MVTKLMSALTSAAFTAGLILFSAALLLTVGRAVTVAVKGNGSRESPPVSVQPRTPAIAKETRKNGIMEKATFGAGCFWGVEAAFRQVKGVTDTAVGYTGGTTKDPTYREVCTGRTGHAEVVQVTFDPDQVRYEELLKVFWENHDPTQRNRQGPDVGAQYRSAIFYHTPEQKATAEDSLREQESSGRYQQPIATEVTPAPEFYRAEEYHQQYLEKQGLASCGIH